MAEWSDAAAALDAEHPIDGLNRVPESYWHDRCSACGHPVELMAAETDQRGQVTGIWRHRADLPIGEFAGDAARRIA